VYVPARVFIRKRRMSIYLSKSAIAALCQALNLLEQAIKNLHGVLSEIEQKENAQ